MTTKVQSLRTAALRFQLHAMRHLVVDPTYGDRLFNRLDRCARQAEELVDDNGSICPESVMWFIMDLDDRLEEVEDKLEQIIHHLGLNNDN